MWGKKLAFEFKIAGGLVTGLVVAALILIALTHGVLELAVNWRKHFIENSESFIPLALALASAPMLLVDSEHHMTELTSSLPQVAILHTRWLALWGPMWMVLLCGMEVMNLIWGPVHFWDGVLAALGPGLFLTGLAIWAGLLSARVAVAYLVAIGLPVADLILRILGAFTVIPPLQLLDVFAYRWTMASPAWWEVKWFMLIIGAALIEGAIRHRRRFLSRAF